MKRTRCILIAILFAAAGAQTKPPEAMLGAALHQEEVAGNFQAAISEYKKVLAAAGVSRPTAAQALYHLGLCYQKLGNAEAKKTFERLLAQYGDQKELAAQARVHLASIGSGHASAATLAVRKIMSDTGDNALWTISSDGRLLSFTQYSTGNAGVRDLETGEDRIVTQYGNWDDSKGYTDQNAISRDGRQVAFWHYMYKGKDGQVRVIGTDGKGERTIYRAKEGEWGIPSDWSPDGKYVLVQLERGTNNSLTEGQTDFAMISVADGSVRVLKSAHYVRRHRPRIMFSPDGRYIAYDWPQQPESANGDLYVMQIEGGRENAIAPHAANDKFLGWSPDGKRIVFLSDRSGSNAIWTVAIAEGKQAGEPAVANANTGAIWPLGITANGSLYYTAENTKSNIYTADIEPATGKVLNTPARLTPQFTDVTARPQWSPDGKRIAFLVRGEGPVPLLSVLTIATGEERHILPQATLGRQGFWPALGQMRWSSDGESILAFGEMPGKRSGLIRISPLTGEASLLSEPHYDFDWTPDARTMFIAVRGVGIHKLVRRDIDSGEERVLYSGNRLPRALSVSPDGRQVAFVMNTNSPGERGSLCVLSTEGGDIRTLMTLTPDMGLSLPWQSRALAWTPDISHILFMMGKKGDMAVWSVPASGGSAVKTVLRAVVSWAQ